MFCYAVMVWLTRSLFQGLAISLISDFEIYQSTEFVFGFMLNHPESG